MKYIKKINLNSQDFVFIPPTATAEQIGGIKAENATDENVELKIDEQGKLYAPQYPSFSGKLDKNQGEDNANKVFVINTEGNLEPTEFKGGSDNRLIATVKKVENANINDSYQTKIENLKLYGKSTQGADPSPDNKQDITSINEFDIAVAGKNLFDVESAKDIGSWDGGVAYRNFTGIYLKPNTTYTFSVSKNNMYKNYKAEYNDNFAFYIGETRNGPSSNILIGNSGTNIDGINNKYTFTTTDKPIYINLYVKKWDSENMNIVFDELLQNIQIELGDTATAYEPYTEQRVNITLPQPMYSTLDGSIADFVDTQNGNEVYNMSGAVVFDGSEDEAWRLYTSQNGFYILLNDMMVGRGQQGFCDKFKVVSSVSLTGIVLGQENNCLYVTQVNSYATTIEEWKTWLSQNPITVVYPLATPNKIPIDSEKLTVLRNLYSYTGITNFLCNAPISFNYEQSVDLVVKDLLSKVQTTGANLLYLNGK